MERVFVLILLAFMCLESAGNSDAALQGITGPGAFDQVTELAKSIPPATRTSERWKFRFDGREWQVGHEAAHGEQSIREYILPGESVNDWTELVTSQCMGADVSPRTWYRQQTEGRQCASFTWSLIEESATMILFEGAHGGCGGFPPAAFVMRISTGRSGIQTLTYGQRGGLSETNRGNWISILKDARIEDSLSLYELGPLPDNHSSKLLETTGTGFPIRIKEDDENNLQYVTSSLSINLRAKSRLPAQAYLEVEFENPDDPDAPVVIGVERESGQGKFLVLSPEFQHLKCWNYEVAVSIYKDKSKQKLLDVHRQTIQSRVNIDKVNSEVNSLEDILTALRHGHCP